MPSCQSPAESVDFEDIVSNSLPTPLSGQEQAKSHGRAVHLAVPPSDQRVFLVAGAHVCRNRVHQSSPWLKLENPSLQSPVFAIEFLVSVRLTASPCALAKDHRWQCAQTTGKRPLSLSGTARCTARPCDFGSSGPLSGRLLKQPSRRLRENRIHSD